MTSARKAFLSTLIACCFCILGQTIFGQSIIRRQDFDANTAWAYTENTGGNFSRSIQAGQIDPSRPGDATFGSISANNVNQIPNNSETSTGYGLSGSVNGTSGTSTLTFAAIPPAAFAGNTDLYISFRVAGIGEAAGAGLDATDQINVFVSLDNGATFTNEARIRGNTDAAWSYNLSQEGVVDFDGDGSVEAAKNFQPAAGTTNDTGAISKLTIRIPDASLNSSTGVIFRITLETNRVDEMIMVDDFIAYTSMLPSAAFSSIGGRVTNSQGAGISKATVKLTNSAGETFYSSTNPFGFYRFDQVSTGQTYVIEASHKSYLFAPSVVFLGNDFETFDIVSLDSRIILPQKANGKEK
ncbi:MAG: carboxypeptidase-like regulatory domain-containing protein [Acidobacteriota bacterium]|nr:carboxypeptidase-like regulatory domain-containing protein [Acidobacteriota bacterium]